VLGKRGSQVLDERGIALIGADGIWSNVASRLRRLPPPTFRHRTAWRALVPADAVPEEFRQPLVHLWLGQDAHLVHYPVKSGTLINIVGIVHDEWNEIGWSAAGDRAEILRHFARWAWSEKARALIAVPQRWLKWALYDRKDPFRGSKVPVTLIGDAAHNVHPLAGQGVNLGLRDARELARTLKGRGVNNDCGDFRLLRRYERARREDILAMQFTTDALHKLFNNDAKWLAGARNFGLRLTNRQAQLKNLLVQHAVG